MKGAKQVAVAVIAMTEMLCAIPEFSNAQAVLQRGYDQNVSGADLNEVMLNTSNVGPNTFGLLFTLPVDANVYAQPLYVPNVIIPGLGTHNVLYVATMNDSIYAFDADLGGAALWSINLASVFSTTAALWANFSFPPISMPGNLGIMSTPVIDPSTNIMYVVACTVESGALAYRLHAIDITDGSEPYGAGVLINADLGGTTFNARYLTQRASLVLAGNQVIVAFGAMQSETGQPFNGWVMAYNKLTLQNSGAFVPEPNGNGGGVWQSGRPPAVDNSGYVYAFVGNAWGGAGYNGTNSFSESVLKLDPTNSLALVDWFTPSNWGYLDANDLDLTSSGPLLIPGTTLLAGGGKTGVLYLLDTTSLGHIVTNDTQVVQKETVATGKLASGPVYWNRSAANGGPFMYNWSPNDVLKAYSFGGTLASAPSMMGANTASGTGAVLALSANVDQPGSGILWATTLNSGSKVGTLHAFDAANGLTELWNSQMNAARDGYGDFANYVPPMISNGKVYVATFYSNKIAAYGILPYALAPSSLSFSLIQTKTTSVPQAVLVTNVSAAPVTIGSVTITGTNAKSFTQTNTCGASIPVGGGCAINVTYAPITSGTNAATVNINGFNGAGTQFVSVVGTAAAPNYSVSPTTLSFGSVMKGTVTASQPVTVSNAGSAGLPITSIYLSGTNQSQFQQAGNCGSVIPAGSGCTINVAFAPSSTGSKSAILNVSAGGGAGVQSVTLSGLAIGSSYKVSPLSLDFGSVSKGTVSANQSVTLTNLTSLALPVTGIALAGTNRSQFVQTNNCGTSVLGNASCIINVGFAPTFTGAKSATLNVTAGGSTQKTTLAGTGI